MIFTQIDVSELPAPEPMTTILSALGHFTQNKAIADQCLVVKHRRQPFPLYEKLIAAGWAYHCEVNTSDDILLFIYQQTAQQKFEQSLAAFLRQQLSQQLANVSPLNKADMSE